MALKSTIFKVELQVADMDRNHYQGYQLTLARHPSETDLRMMVRLLAFAMNADEQLTFTKGLCVDDEPDLWQKSLSGEIECWIDLGQPDERRIRKACSRAEQVTIYCYNQRSATIWWQQIRDKLGRFDNLTVFNLADETTQAMAALAQRNMQLQCTIQDGQLWFGNDSETLLIEPELWLNPNSA